MVQLCRMQYAYGKSKIRVVSCKSNLQLACDCRLRHEECRGLLKHVLKHYDNRTMVAATGNFISWKWYMTFP